MKTKKEKLNDANNPQKTSFFTRNSSTTKPTSSTQEEQERAVKASENGRHDMHNLCYDEQQQMYYYLPKDHPDYREHPKDSAKGCNIL